MSKPDPSSPPPAETPPLTPVPASQRPAWERRRKQVMVALSLAMLLYLSLTLWSGWEQLWTALRDFPVLTHLPAVLGLVTVGLLLRALRWEYYNRHLNWNVPALPNLHVFLASFAFTATPGKAGEVVKSFLLRSRYKVRITESASVLMIERLQDLLAVLLLAAGGFSMLAQARLFFGLCVGAVLAVTVFLVSEPLHGTVIGWMERFHRLQPVAEKLHGFFAVGRSLFRLQPFAIGLALALLAWLLEAVALHLIFQGFGLSLPLLTSFFIYGLATVIGALSMLPGGLGGFEAAMLFLLKSLHVGAGVAVASTVLIRFSTLWFASLIGMAFLGLWQVTHREKATSVSTEAPSTAPSSTEASSTEAPSSASHS